MTKTTLFGRRGMCGAVAAAVFLGLAQPALAWDQPQWVRQLGTSEPDSAYGVTTDDDGNVYIAGHTSGSLGEPNRGGVDAWVAKYSAAGALRWTRQLDSSESGAEAAYGVATDGDGNVYIAGYTSGSLGEPNRGGIDGWVAKYSSAGALRWTRQLGTAESDSVWAVATDGGGNVYIAGSTGSGGGPGGVQGEYDAWVAKYSPAGALRWTRQLDSSESGAEAAYGVATDGDGNVYIAGYTSGSLGEPNRGGVDAWVAKYSSAGALRWTRQLGTADYEAASGVATDGDGNVYIAGLTTGSLGGTYPGSWDAWVAKYSSAGALRWTRQLGTADYEAASGIATDGDGNVYIAGLTTGSLGGPQQGNGDALVAKYSAAGSLRWKRQLGTVDYEAASGIATDGGGNVYIVGLTTGSLGGANQGYEDAWVAKYQVRR